MIMVPLLKGLLPNPPGWYVKIHDPQDSWLAGDNSLLRPWPLVSTTVVPSGIYSNGVINPQLTEHMQQAAGEQLALALVNEERALVATEAKQAQITVFDILQRVKAAAMGTDGTMNALVSAVRKLQTQEVMADVEEAEQQLVIWRNMKEDVRKELEVLKAECAERANVQKGIKSQIGDFSAMNEMLSRVRRNIWREMTDKLDPRLQPDWEELNRQREEIKDANTRLARLEPLPDTGTKTCNVNEESQVRELLSYAFKYRGEKAKYVWELVKQQAERDGYSVSFKRKLEQMQTPSAITQ